MATAAQLLIKVGADTADAEAGMGRMGTAVNNVADFMKGAISQAAGFLIAQPIMNAVGGAFSFVQDSAIGFNSQLQQAKIGFTTMLGSGQKAQDFLNQLGDFAAKTPFDFGELVPAAQHMLAFGFSAKDVIPNLTAIGDAVAALGGDSAMVDRVTNALGQMKAHGTADAQDMLQLTEAGIPAWDLLAKGIGKSTSETMKLVSQGVIPANDAINIITSGMEKNFGGLMDKQSHTFQGAMSNIHDSLQRVLSGAFLPFFDKISDGAQKVADFLSTEKFKAFAGEATTVLGNFTNLLAGGLGTALKDGIGWIKDIKDNMQQWWPVVAIGAGILGGLLVAAFVAVGTAAWAAAAGVIAATWPFIAIGAAIAALVGGLIWAYNNWGFFHDAVDKVRLVLDNLPAIFGAVGAAVGGFFGGIGSAVGGFFQALPGAISTWLSAVRNTITGWGTGIWAWVQEWGGKALDLLTWPYRTAVSLVEGALNWVQQTVQNGLSIVLGIFQWLYDNNHYVRDMVTAIQTDIAFLQAFFPAAFQAISDAVGGALGWIRDTATDAWNFIVGIIQTDLAFVQGIISTVFGAVVQTALNEWALFQQYVVTPVRNAWTFIQQTLGNIGGWFSDRFHEVVNAAQTGWTNFLNTIKSLKDRVGSFIHDSIIQPIVDKITGLGSQLLNLGKTVMGQFFNGIVGAIKGFVNSQIAGFGNILSFLGFDPSVINSLPHFATGGTMQSAGWAVVGEHGPELVSLSRGAQVVPLSRARRTSGGAPVASGGNVYHFHFAQGSIVTPAPSAAAFFDDLEREAHFRELGYGR